MNKVKDTVMKESKKAHRVVDYTQVLVHRIISNATNDLVRHAYRTARDRGTWGKDYEFHRTDMVVKTIRSINQEFDKLVTDIGIQTNRIARNIAQISLEKTPKDEFDREAILTALLFGSTFRRRVIRYSQKFRRELQLYIAYGMHNDIEPFEIIQMYLSNIRHPYKPKKIQEFAYEIGFTIGGVASFNRLATLTTDVCDRNFTEAVKFYGRYAKKVEIVAIVDERTCEICLGHNGRVTTLDDPDLPKFHAHCRCFLYLYP